jgi:hypothetical protein
LALEDIAPSSFIFLLLTHQNTFQCLRVVGIRVPFLERFELFLGCFKKREEEQGLDTAVRIFTEEPFLVLL